MELIEPEQIKQVTFVSEDRHSQIGRCKYQGRFACAVRIYKTRNITRIKLLKLVASFQKEQKTVPAQSYILQFLGCAIGNDINLICLTELVMGDILRDFLIKQPVFSEGQLPIRMKLANGIVSGLAFLHSNSIILRNLNSSNIYIDQDDNYCPRLASILDHEIIDYLETEVYKDKGLADLYWKAPELDSSKYSSGSFEGDLYSLGVVFYEIAIANQPLSPGLLKQKPISFISENDHDPKYLTITRNLLDASPNSRPAAAEVATALDSLTKIYTVASELESNFETSLSLCSVSENTRSYTYNQEELTSMVDRGVALYKRSKFVDAVKLFDIPAWNGEVRAQFYLGKAHLNGHGRQANISLACGWLEKAADKGHKEAQYLLAMVHFFGLHPTYEETKESAFRSLEKLAKQGHQKAALNVAFCYETGSGVPQNIKTALKLYEDLSMFQDNPMIFYRAGLLCERSSPDPDYDQAFNWYRRGATEGNIHCEYRLALCYHHGYGVAEDPIKAMEWYTTAADKFHPTSLYVIGHKYFKGQGLQKSDPHMAINYYTQAGLRGNTKAQQALAHIYEKGLGVASSLELAAHWYAKAASSGDPYAQNNLGRFYQNGMGVEINLFKAVRLYRKSASRGIMQAQVNYARCLELGLGLAKPDPDEAFKWYNKASEQNSPHAQFKLAHCYQRGIGTTPDTTLALSFYEKSAKSGYHRAIDKLKQLGHDPPRIDKVPAPLPK